MVFTESERENKPETWSDPDLFAWSDPDLFADLEF